MSIELRRKQRVNYLRCFLNNILTPGLNVTVEMKQGQREGVIIDALSRFETLYRQEIQNVTREIEDLQNPMKVKGRTVRQLNTDRDRRLARKKK